MQSKIFTLTATFIALLSLPLFVMAQGRIDRNAAASEKMRIPMPKVINLDCQSEKKEFGQYLFVTNTSGQLIKKNAVVKYAVGTTPGQFTLANALAANATLKQQSASYSGSPACKAWMFQ